MNLAGRLPYLDHTARRASAPVLGLIGTQDVEPEVALADLEGAHARGEAALIAFVHHLTKRAEATIHRALRATPDDQFLSYIRAACSGDQTLYERIRPFASLIRKNTFDRPVVIPGGSVYVTLGDERRKTGTHYTPTSLTEPIVRHTLEPVVFSGPAEGQPRETWKLIPLAELLGVKVCDMAMGSGAFLVQACRYLSERVVEAIEALPAGVIPGELDDGARRLVAEIQVAIESEERLALARRLVVDRCLYGVDKNLLAVEMAKLSLWLITLDRNRPFTFLDHALKCGDSLLGISDVEQLAHWTLRTNYTGLTRNHLSYPIERTLKRALVLRRRIRETPVSDAKIADQKCAWLAEAQETLGLVRLAADLLVAAALHPEQKQREGLRKGFLDRIASVIEAVEAADYSRPGAPNRAGNDAELAALRREADELLRGHRPFHWPLEFPEVFVEGSAHWDREAEDVELDIILAAGNQNPEAQIMHPGFAAIVGNPPFMGGKMITGVLGSPYRDFLVDSLADGRRGSADFCTYFFLRAHRNLRKQGSFGLIATNTIAQGDTREVGLDYLIDQGASIYRAVNNYSWPGLAAVSVNIIHVSKGKTNIYAYLPIKLGVTYM